MKEPKYDLIIRVTSAAKAAMIIQLLDGEARLVSMKEVVEDVASGQRAIRYANGARLKGISGPELLVRLLGDHKPHPRHEIERAFIEHGFAWTSVGPVLSLARKEGRLLVNPDSTLQLLMRNDPPRKTQ